MASSMPLPVSAGLYEGDPGLESQLKRSSDNGRRADGKKSRATKGSKKSDSARNAKLHSSMDASRTMPTPDEPGLPLGPENAWGSSKNIKVPEKFARGKSNRLYL